MLTESLLLAFAAGFAGVIGAAASLRLLLELAPSRLPRLAEVGIDARVLVFSVAVCLFTGILFRLAPALQTPAIELAGRLREAGRGAVSSRRQAFATAALVTAEFAICPAFPEEVQRAYAEAKARQTDPNTPTGAYPHALGH